MFEVCSDPYRALLSCVLQLLPGKLAYGLAYTFHEATSFLLMASSKTTIAFESTIQLELSLFQKTLVHVGIFLEFSVLWLLLLLGKTYQPWL